MHISIGLELHSQSGKLPLEEKPNGDRWDTGQRAVAAFRSAPSPLHPTASDYEAH